MGEGISARLSTGEYRKFGLTVGAAFVVFGGIVGWRGHELTRAVLLTLGGLLVAGGAVVPSLLGPIYRAWMGLAKVLSRVTTPIFLGVVYFLVFTPVGLFRRAIGKNALDREAVDGSFFLPRSRQTSGDMRRLF